MKRKIKNYKSSIILIISMIIGLIIGLIFKEKASVLTPLGDLFINLLSTLIVPLIFVTITLSIAKMVPGKVVKLLKNILFTFIIFTLFAVFTGILATSLYKFVNTGSISLVNEVISSSEKTTVLEKIVSMFSVNDFNLLLSKSNMIALIVISIITGLACQKDKTKSKAFVSFLESFQEILMNVLKIIMYYAPIGIASYFAVMVGTFGASFATSYIKVFVYYTIISIIFALLFYSFIAFISGKSIRKFWKESVPIIICSLSTCSSASCLPINIEVTKKLDVDESVSKTTTSLGTSFHKDGSVIDSVFKIMFLVYLFGTPISIFKVIFVAIAASLLITAVPIGGGTISEMFILTSLGFPITALPLLTIIATITDAPATLLNSLGDTSACLMVDSLNRKDTTL